MELTSKVIGIRNCRSWLNGAILRLSVCWGSIVLPEFLDEGGTDKSVKANELSKAFPLGSCGRQKAYLKALRRVEECSWRMRGSFLAWRSMTDISLERDGFSPRVPRLLPVNTAPNATISFLFIKAAINSAHSMPRNAEIFNQRMYKTGAYDPANARVHDGS
jgi:hypothetical protein